MHISPPRRSTSRCWRREAAEASPHRPQLARMRAATRVVTQLAQFAPDYALDPNLAATGTAALAHADCHYEIFASAAALALESIPDSYIASAVRWPPAANHPLA